MDLFKKIDLYVTKIGYNLKNAIAIASEHNFRSIVVPFNRLEELKKLTKDTDLLSIAAVDFPMGSSPLDVRIYSVMSAKEHKCDEIEICLPYHSLDTKKNADISEDIKSNIDMSIKLKMPIRYMFNQIICLSPNIKKKIIHYFGVHRDKDIKSHIGFFNLNNNDSDNIIEIRDYKQRISALSKVYLKNVDVSVLNLYIKSGVDIIGLDIENAVFLSHEYETLLSNSTNE